MPLNHFTTLIFNKNTQKFTKKQHFFGIKAKFLNTQNTVDLPLSSNNKYNQLDKTGVDYEQSFFKHRSNIATNNATPKLNSLSGRLFLREK